MYTCCNTPKKDVALGQKLAFNIVNSIEDVYHVDNSITEEPQLDCTLAP